MDAVSPLYLLLAGLICSFVGRFMLVRAAWEISKGWGIAVACVPLAPLFFRWNYKELAGEGKNWLMATNICFVTFGALTGSRGIDSIDDLWTLLPERFRPAEYAEHRDAGAEEIVPEGEEEKEEPEEVDAVETESSMPPATRARLAPAAAPAEKKGFFGRIATLLHRDSPEPAKSATAAALAPALPAGPTLAERLASNQAEFARLGQVYETLKKERGYLKKWDQDQIKTYNEQAAKYQADLAKARADQVELNKQIAAIAKK